MGRPELNIFRHLWLKLRIVWRDRTFKRGRKMGMTVQEARTYMNEMHPLTPAEAEYEKEIRRNRGDSN